MSSWEEIVMTFKKIVVGLDQSFKDSMVFARALEQARTHVSQMLIVHTLKYDRETPATITSGVTSGNHTDDARDMYAMLQRRQQTRIKQASEKAHDWLEMYFQQAIAKGIPTQLDCRASEPGLWLCEVAQRWGADLIVIGHRDHQGLKSVGTDSVTQYVLQHSPCSVLVVNGVPNVPEHQPLSELNQINQHEQLKKQALVKSPRTAAQGILESQRFRI
jgi:nucleotide-binding universal stress UspA family protein